MNVTKRNRLKFKNKQWLIWRKKKRIAAQLFLARIMARNVAAHGVAQINLIRSSTKPAPEKAIAIAKAVVDTNIAIMKTFKKYAPN